MKNRRSAREHEEVAGNRGIREAFKETIGEKLSTFFLPLFITAKFEVIATTKPFLRAWSEKKKHPQNLVCMGLEPVSKCTVPVCQDNVFLTPGF